MPDVRIARAHQKLRISVADVETSKLLGVPLNSAVGEVVRVFNDTKGRVMYLAEITYRAEYIRFQMELKAVMELIQEWSTAFRERSKTLEKKAANTTCNPAITAVVAGITIRIVIS